MTLKRLTFAILFGVIFGLLCMTGVYFLVPETSLIPNKILYMAGAFYNRGAILGIVVSVGFAFLQAYTNINFFIMGIIFGLLNDFITTKLTKSD